MSTDDLQNRADKLGARLEAQKSAVRHPAPYLISKVRGLFGRIEYALSLRDKGWHARAESELDFVEAEIDAMRRKT